MSDSEIENVGKEVAETANKGIDLAEKLGAFLSRALGEPVEVGVGIIKDKLEVFRWERQNRLIDRVTVVLRNRNMEGKTIAAPPKIVLPAFENGGWEDSDEIQDIWARLLAAAVDPTRQGRVRTAFIGLIREMEALDARILSYCYRATRNYAPIRNDSRFVYSELSKFPPIDRKEVEESLGISFADYDPAVENLVRLRLLSPFVEERNIEFNLEYMFGSDEIRDSQMITYNYGIEKICLTALGDVFVTVCMTDA